MIDQTGYNNHIWDNVLQKLQKPPAKCSKSRKTQEQHTSTSLVTYSNANSALNSGRSLEITELERKIEVRQEQKRFPPIQERPNYLVQNAEKSRKSRAPPALAPPSQIRASNRAQFHQAPQIQEPKILNQCLTTDEERRNAPQPKMLPTWKYTPTCDNLMMYDSRAASDAFQDYAHRMKAKKLKIQAQSQAPRIRETPILCPRIPNPEPEFEICNRNREVCRNRIIEERRQLKQYQQQNLTLDFNPEHSGSRKIPNSKHLEKTVQMTRVRDDEISIIKYENQVEEAAPEPCVRKPMCQTQAPLQAQAFYGTIEAQVCASRAAENISVACENLQRLHFVSEAVFPNSGKHLKTLKQIGGEIRDFNAQIGSHRVNPPRNLNMNSTHVAHFILEG